MVDVMFESLLPIAYSPNHVMIHRVRPLLITVLLHHPMPDRAPMVISVLPYS